MGRLTMRIIQGGLSDLVEHVLSCDDIKTVRTS